MKFDVVIGNPPYNNDLYIDFVKWGHQRSNKYSLWITPAKWQAKGGDKNERFRQQIVPYMKDIVYYPDCTDVFDISDVSGISYYLIDKEVHNNKNIKNISVRNPKIDSEDTRLFNNTLLNIADNVISRNREKIVPINLYKYDIGKFNASVCKLIRRSGSGHKDVKGDYTCLYSTQGSILLLGDIYISNNDDILSGSEIIFRGTKYQCESFKSFMYCRLTRFFMMTSLCTTNILSKETWRFVPDPGAFDHIFTDEELYDKYGLTQKEINIIESVIKERPFSTVWSWIPKEYQELGGHII